MNKDLLFAKSHEWIKKAEDGDVLLGLSQHAVDEMGDLVFINLPSVGEEFSAGDVLGDVESVKAVSDIYSIVSGRIVEVNEELEDAPEKLNEAPYENWIVRLSDVDIPGDLLTEEEYLEFIKDE